MELGMRMWMLWRLRAGVALSAVLGLMAAVWTLNVVTLFPPGVTSRVLEMATASTQVVVDTPTSALLDLRQDTHSFDALRNRAVLLGNVMASYPVQREIARRAGVPVEALEVSAPRTPEQPRAVSAAGPQRHTSDILRSNEQYRLSIQANSTVPVLEVYAQTPTPESSAALANAAVDALGAHLARLAAEEGTPDSARIRLMQLGRARGAMVNGGTAWQAAVLAFLVTFAAACATVLLVSRVTEGWRHAALSGRRA
jgi:hypothetical protein